ncbi:MAG: glycoside hydrolase family 28 protein [Oscillospiraceae bacterium]|nr:glycoside hydrolase family 28 protein [Oscillospiraceae bacterium]
MDKQQMRKAILAGIRQPQIPEKVVNARAFGILTGTGENQTRKIQSAIDMLSEQGGGRLILPEGIYLTGALQLRSGVELHLESPNTILRFINTEIENHYPVVYSHWEASPCLNYSALLYARNANNIAVTGPGVLDGAADQNHWWNWHHQVEEAWSENAVDLQQHDRLTLRSMNMEGVPVEKRCFGPGHFLRPNMVQLIGCERVLLQGFKIINSPMWQLNPVFCRSVIVDGLTLSSHGSNNDGCDPESCNGVWIKNCCFDTGDDCISLKSGRDRDGLAANTPCENVLIENNDFADGHGGIALGSEMSGGIRFVLADNNRFSSPNLTYALRLKTNARRGGFVENVMLSGSVMSAVHGAAVHGTMLYEDGRNGDMLPVFRDITIEDIEAHGGDYGIFLEAFPEVPITGLVLRNIRIDGVRKTLRSMNWQNPVIDNVIINGKQFPRPGWVRILGVPSPGTQLKAEGDAFPGETLAFSWEISKNGIDWVHCGMGDHLSLPKEAAYVRVTASDKRGNTETSRVYTVLSDGAVNPVSRLICRGMLPERNLFPDEHITRAELAEMLVQLADPTLTRPVPTDSTEKSICLAVANRFFPLDKQGHVYPNSTVTRQEMASVAMQACGVSYRNASSTMPVCADVGDVAANYGTNVARALYFGFMSLKDGRFWPQRSVTVGEAIAIIDRVADFAGL